MAWISDYSVYGQVNNVGPGLKLAVGLRPSFKSIRAMWMTALLPFYENPVDTTGVAICHLGPSFKVMLSVATNMITLKLKGLLSSAPPAGSSLMLDADENRGRNWWKDKYEFKKFREPGEDAAATSAIPAADQDLTSEIEI